MYQALYRKWRSRTFDQVVGQEHVTQTLRRQVQSGRLSHAYLFTGTRGTGKTSCAKLLARAVNCENPQDGNPCNACSACLGIENGSILDVLELDAASNNRVDDIRAILDEAVYTPAAVKKRVYIIDEVHMLSTQAFNALLQILEEPPTHLMFILATTEIHKVPATIKSRCQQFAFKRIHAPAIAAHLERVAQVEGIGLTAPGAELIARLADGGMRDALSLLDQCASGGGTVDEERVFTVLGLAGNVETAALLDHAAGGDAAAALERLDKLYAGGKEMTALAGELSGLVRDLLVYKTAPNAGAALMTGGFDRETLKRLAGRFDAPRLVQMLNLLQRTAADLTRSANRRTDMELCLVTLCNPALDQSPAGLSARIARLEQGAMSVPVQHEASKAPSAPARETPSRREPPRDDSRQDNVSWEEPPLRDEDAPPPRDEDAPPWDEPPAAEPKKKPARPVEEKRPVPPPVQTPFKPQSASRQSTGGSWPGWTAFLVQLKGVLDMSDYAFLSNSSMTQGSWDGHALTLWAANDFLRDMLDRTAITRPIAQLAERLTGVPVRVVVLEGKVPEGGAAPAPAEQIPAPPPADPLETFIAQGGSNVTVE